MGDQFCTAYTLGGKPCRNRPVAGLTVCRHHRANKRAEAGGGDTVVRGVWQPLGRTAKKVAAAEALQDLIAARMADAAAIREWLSRNEAVGLLVDTDEVVDADGGQAVGASRKRVVKRLRTHPLVEELHKAEADVAKWLSQLALMTGEQLSDAQVRLQAGQVARAAARLAKAYPGISVDDIAREVLRAG